MGSMNSPSGKKGKGKAGAQSDVDIYNIINAEEKDTGSKKRKGLALGQVCKNDHPSTGPAAIIIKCHHMCVCIYTPTHIGHVTLCQDGPFQ